MAYETVTITAGQTVSNSISYGSSANSFILLEVGSSFTAGDLSFQTKGNDGTYRDLHNSAGELIKISSSNLLSNKIYTLDPSVFYGVGDIKIKMSTTQVSGATFYIKVDRL